MSAKRFARGAVIDLFYLHRCIVCEKPIKRTTANRKICKRSKAGTPWAPAKDSADTMPIPSKRTRVPKNLELMQKSLIPMRVGKRFRHPRPDQYSLRGSALAYGGRAI